jgi:cellulose synthase operon protein C
LLTLVLPLAAAWVGEKFTVDLLQQAASALDGIASGEQHPQVLERQLALAERSLFFAAHFDRLDLARAFADRLGKMVQTHTGSDLLECTAPVLGESLRSMGRVGLREHAERLLRSVTEAVYRGRSLVQLKAESSGDWAHTLRLAVRLAAGWLSYDGADRAMPVLDEARAVILAGKASSAKKYIAYVDLVRAYVAALEQLPVNEALGRMEELFTSPRFAELPNSQTTKSHYSRLHLNVVEAVVLALASDDFALGPAARRWLDDDEYLVRRRIHRDVRAALAHAGM